MSGTGPLMATPISAAEDPLYMQVYSAISEAINRGQLRPGDRLPTERALCDQLGVSRATVRRALGRLASEGLVEATVGRGSFVSARPLQESLNDLMSFTELAAARGLEASARVLRQAVRPAHPEEAPLFGIDLQDLVFDLERVRMMDGVAIALDQSRVPVSIAPKIADADYATASMFSRLEEAGVAPVLADVVVSAVGATENQASVLEVDPGAPLLVCTAMSHDASGRLVEISEMAYRADRYRFRAQVRRAGRGAVAAS